jgi:hypothetical protein
VLVAWEPVVWALEAWGIVVWALEAWGIVAWVPVGREPFAEEQARLQVVPHRLVPA